MCGIAGIFALNDSVPPIHWERLKRMSDTMIHRGPDDEGITLTPGARAGLAARRLSIIDVFGGHQPVSNEDESVWGCLNGEIYNHRPLKAALENLGHRFKSRCDTEVLVHLYEEYGRNGVEHLNGMFAFAVWDARNRRGMVVRDRLGIKPLYYTIRGSELIFASELRGVLAGLSSFARTSSLSLDYEALDEFFSLGYIASPRSIFSEIKKLPPGHLISAADHHVRVEPYWQLSEQIHPLEATKNDLPEMVEEARCLLADAVKLRLISDVPLGVFLSGGIDSGAVTALMAGAGHQPLRTFTIGFEDPSFDETSLARRVAERYGTEHVEERLTPNLASELPRVAASFDEPFADPSMLPTYWVSRLARRHVTVCLSGEGGDEVFAGYETYTAYRLARWYRRVAPGPIGTRLLPALVSLIPPSERKMSFEYRLRKFINGALYSPETAHYAYKEISGLYALAKKEDFYGGPLREHLMVETALKRFREDYARFSQIDPLNRILAMDAVHYLPDDLLTKVDRASMAHSLEARVPFLDHRLVEFAFSLPSRLKMPGLKRKHLLKLAVKDLLPPEIISGRKKGFSLPLAAWLRRDLRPLRDDLLSETRVRETGLLDPAGVKKLLQEHDAGQRNHGRILWCLMTFILWREENKRYL